MKRIFQLIDKNLRSLKLSLFAKKTPDKNLPLITISREKGSGGRMIAHLVAKKLGNPWKVYHKEIVEEIAKNTHLEKELINEIDEKHVSLIDDLVSNFFGKKNLSLSGYYKQLIKIISTINQRGFAIIVGRGANFLLPHALKVRTICEFEQRITWLMKFENISRREAMARIEKSDRERREFIETLFHHDHRKARHYDLIIRTSSDLSIEDASNLIVKLAKKRFKL